MTLSFIYNIIGYINIGILTAMVENIEVRNFGKYSYIEILFPIVFKKNRVDYSMQGSFWAEGTPQYTYKSRIESP